MKSLRKMQRSYAGESAGLEIETMLNRLDHDPGELMLRSDLSAVRGRRALQAMMDKERTG